MPSSEYWAPNEERLIAEVEMYVATRVQSSASARAPPLRYCSQGASPCHMSLWTCSEVNSGIMWCPNYLGRHHTSISHHYLYLFIWILHVMCFLRPRTTLGNCHVASPISHPVSLVKKLRSCGQCSQSLSVGVDSISSMIKNILKDKMYCLYCCHFLPYSSIHPGFKGMIFCVMASTWVLATIDDETHGRIKRSEGYARDGTQESWEHR